MPVDHYLLEHLLYLPLLPFLLPIWLLCFQMLCLFPLLLEYSKVLSQALQSFPALLKASKTSSSPIPLNTFYLFITPKFTFLAKLSSFKLQNSTQSYRPVFNIDLFSTQNTPNQNLDFFSQTCTSITVGQWPHLLPS